MSPVLDPLIAHLHTMGRRHFSLAALLEATQLRRKPVLRVCDRLTRLGILKHVGDDPIPPGWGEVGRERRNPTWTVVGDLGAVPRPRRQKPTKRDRMWAYMSDNMYFTVGDLQITLDDGEGQSHHTPEEYVRTLAKHGYLRAHGRRGLEKLYKLIKGRGKDRPRLPDSNTERRRAARMRGAA